MRRPASRDLFSTLILASCLAACSSGGGNTTPPPSMTGGNDQDMGGQSDDGGGTHHDMGGGEQDMATNPGLPCIPGTQRCGPLNAVEICSSTGSEWKHSATCPVSCSAGLCMGGCNPGEKRCNVKNVEQCDPTGTAWTVTESCTASCAVGKCTLVSLDITMNQNLDGEIIVDNDVVVHSGVTVTSPTGDLTIRANNITIENASTITAAAKGNPSGLGQGASCYSYCYTQGGGYGSDGGGASNAFGSTTDMDVQPGGNGGNGYSSYYGGKGGGVIRLIAKGSLTIAGFVTANGTDGVSSTAYPYSAGGGGAGGGILLAASGPISMTGTVSAAGGMGGAGSYFGYAGGQGRVKILGGDSRNITGTITGIKTEGLLPPTGITSSTHPDSALIYNDNFDSVDLKWVKPFATLQGYWQLVSQNASQVPTAATGAFVTTESKSYTPSTLKAGSNWFHIVPVDASSYAGTVESTFLIQINSGVPSINSISHPTGTWVDKPDVSFSWSLPVADKNLQGVWYVLDRYGDTIPTKSDTLLPLPKKTQLVSGVTSGIWVIHMLAMDQKGYLTKNAAHYQIKVGTDPGNGVVLGLVTDSGGKAISGATVSINRGLWSMATNSSGNFNFPSVSADNYELRVTAPGKTPVTQTITVSNGMSTTANVSLP